MIWVIYLFIRLAVVPSLYEEKLPSLLQTGKIQAKKRLKYRILVFLTKKHPGISRNKLSSCSTNVTLVPNNSKIKYRNVVAYNSNLCFIKF